MLLCKAAWSDTFESYTDQQTVKYFADESGSFNAAKAPGQGNDASQASQASPRGMVLQQAVTQPPINGAWWGNSEPYSLLGNSQNWTDTTVEADVFVTATTGGRGPAPRDGYAPISGALLAGSDLGAANLTWTQAVGHCNRTAGCLGFTFRSADSQPTEPVHVYFKKDAEHDADADWKAWVRESDPGGVMPAPAFARVCARISTFKPNGEPPQGYCLIVDGGGKWYLAAGGKADGYRDRPTLLASGTVPGKKNGPFIGSWHRLRLDVVGSVLTGSVDGTLVGSTTDANATFTHGMVAIGSGWHVAYFDNFAVNTTHGSP